MYTHTHTCTYTHTNTPTHNHSHPLSIRFSYFTKGLLSLTLPKTPAHTLYLLIAHHSLSLSLAGHANLSLSFLLLLFHSLSVSLSFSLAGHANLFA